MANTAIVKASALGSNCWLPARFVDGARCPRVMQCTYPEKHHCKAVQAEVDYLTGYHSGQIAEHEKQLAAALAELNKYGGETK